MGVNALRVLAFGAILSLSATANASDDSASYATGGKHFDANDSPTYLIGPEGGTDWFTANGYEAYHRLCQGCHGPKGTGSEYGSALLDAVRRVRYFDFVDAVVNGAILQTATDARMMPAFGTNPKVMCQLDAIYIYLRAEAAGVLRDGAPKMSPDASEQPAIELADCLQE